MNKIVYLYVFDTMADWEIGYLTAEINSGRYFRKGIPKLKIVTVGLTKDPITTMGGIKLLPEIKLEDCQFDGTEALILPGGDTWLDSIHERILDFAEMCLRKNIIVAAICGATFGLARRGMLDSRHHTSNDLTFLKEICPNYKGADYYKDIPAVTDEKLITAPGTSPLEFAFEVIKALDVFEENKLEAWYKLYSTHDAKYYYELVGMAE